MIIKNMFGTVFKGTLDKRFTASQWKGIEYIKKYVRPSNPRTPLQVRHRLVFAKGVETWRDLYAAQQHFYNRLAERMTGFNLFVKRWIEAHTADLEGFNFPVVLEGTAEEGSDGENCWFILKKPHKTIFQNELSDGPFEIAMSVEDTPYQIVLRRGSQEDVVETVDDVLELDVPMTVRSEMLDLSVVLDLPEHIRPTEDSREL